MSDEAKEVPTEVPVKPKRVYPKRPTYRGSGRYKEVRDMKKALSIIANPTLKAAYKEMNPGCADSTATSNSSELLTPEVFQKVKELLSMESVVKANRDILEKVLFVAVSRWMSGKEQTRDMIAAIRELTKLVPEFKDKVMVEDLKAADEKELDRRLRSFGYDPNLIPKSCN